MGFFGSRERPSGANVEAMIFTAISSRRLKVRYEMSGPSGYDSIADEYYLQRHVTSRNFDAATLAYLAQNAVTAPAAGLALDLGAGRGRLTEYLRVPAARIVQVDISLPMLTLRCREASIGHVNAAAQQLPFRSGVFALVGAFLFDPFNETRLFGEVARVLKSGGFFIGSLPHFLWGTTLRSVKAASPSEATFLLQDGRRYVRPSSLSPDEDLRMTLGDAGLLVRSMVSLTLPRTVTDVSPDVELPARALGVSVYDLPIVQCFVAARP